MGSVPSFSDLLEGTNCWGSLLVCFNVLHFVLFLTFFFFLLKEEGSVLDLLMTWCLELLCFGYMPVGLG